jgi:hypothetical protein
MPLKITFEKSSQNAFGATVGQLTLFDGSTVVRQSSAFSGGHSFNPIDDGNYRLRLDVRGDESSNQLNPDGTLHFFFGIQRVSSHIPDGHGGTVDHQWEWGTIRARLNPIVGTDHGDYIHGKHRPEDWTHGCVCDRSESLLTYLWNLASPPNVIDVVVSGGHRFNLEEILERNRGRKDGGSARHEVAGSIRGLDGMNFPQNTGCQAFLRSSDGEIVLFTNSPRMQTLLETAFETQSKVTAVYELINGRHTILQLRFNHPKSDDAPR